MTNGLIINPKSGKERGDGLALADKLAGVAGVQIAVLERFEDLVPRLMEMAEQEVTTLFISSGDGTVQQIQTELAERKLFRSSPELCLLPHGTTNMTGADLGLKVKKIDEQARIISDLDYCRERTEGKVRATIRVTNPADGKVRHGMFVGTGAVWRGTLFCQEAVHDKGLRGDWATFATLATAVVKELISSKSDGRDRIAQGNYMKVRTGGGLEIEGNQLLFLATTLDKLILNSRPFWGPRTGTLRASIFPYPPPSVLRWLWKSMYGSPNRKMPEGCHSFSSDVMTIETRCTFVIDGEFFEPPAGEPLRIEKGAEFIYLCGK
ncbi:MAG: diacylglycerol kinase family protein [Hyphomicrobiales bacterium]|nr:diacylglycerol kinase family protein [Hyphomicrobiales bacterium]